MNGDFEIDEVRRDFQRDVEVGAVQHAARRRLEGEDGVPGLRPGEPVEPAGSVRREQVGERRIVRAVSAFTNGLECTGRREEPAERLHVVTDVDDAHGQRDRVAARVSGVAVAVPPLEREAQRLAHGGAEVEPLDEHVGHFAP